VFDITTESNTKRWTISWTYSCL